MIEHVIEDIVNRIPPSFGDNLTGFVIDVEHYLEESEVLESICVRRAANARSLVEVSASVTRSTPAIQDLWDALLNAWNYISYQHFGATGIQAYREATVLRFVTVISNDVFHVTGVVRVAGDHYPKLVERYNQRFGSSCGPLPAIGSAEGR